MYKLVREIIIRFILGVTILMMLLPLMFVLFCICHDADTFKKELIGTIKDFVETED